MQMGFETFGPIGFEIRKGLWKLRVELLNKQPWRYDGRAKMPGTPPCHARRPPQCGLRLTMKLAAENRRLKNDLFVVRQAMVDLLDLQDLLDGYFRVETFEDLDLWREKCAEAIIAVAWVRPGEEMGDPRWPRAICPLCDTPSHYQEQRQSAFESFDRAQLQGLDATSVLQHIEQNLDLPARAVPVNEFGGLLQRRRFAVSQQAPFDRLETGGCVEFTNDQARGEHALAFLRRQLDAPQPHMLAYLAGLDRVTRAHREADLADRFALT